MINFDISFVIQLVNFLIVLLVLNFLLFRPIRSILKQRAEKMGAQMTDIEQFNSQAGKKMADYKAELDKARKEGVSLRDKLKEEGHGQEKSLVADAGKEAASKLKSSRDQIAGQAKSALDALKKDVDGYAARVADKILGQA